MTEEKSLNFPIQGRASCPNCGSEEQIARQYFSELESKGKIPKDSLTHGCQLRLPIMQVLTGPIVSPKAEIPILTIDFDVCGVCFTIYATSITVINQAVQMKQVGPQMNKGQSPFEGLPFGHG